MDLDGFSVFFLLLRTIGIYNILFNIRGSSMLSSSSTIARF